MTHYMRLRPLPFFAIKEGRKKVEMRLYDEKRQRIRPGDIIVFTNTATGETLQKTVGKLHCFESFAALYRSLPLLKCGYTPEDIHTADPADMQAYYSPAQQSRYGVVGIELI